MRSNRITPLHVYLIGLVLMLIVGVGLYFALLRPAYADAAAKKQEVAAAEAQTVTIGDEPEVKSQTFSYTVETGPDQVKKAKASLEKVRANKESKERELAILEARKQLAPPHRINIGDGTPQTIVRQTMANWLNLPRVVIPLMNRFADKLAAKHGVQVLHQFAGPAPSTDPNSIPKDIIAWNLGKMSATGPFLQVMQWARDWNSAPLLVAVDGLEMQLVGTGGKVTATANLTVYVFPTGKAVVIPQGGGAPAGGGGGFGGGGNGPMGMPGGGNGAGPPTDAAAPGMPAGKGP